ncbi:MAG TPA: hypothetical protein VGL81_07330 [Polyangiaceae bacterium]|jgi:hypothetical protein
MRPWLAVAAVLLGCSHPSGDAASASASASPPTPTPTPVPTPTPTPAPVPTVPSPADFAPAGQADRSTLSSLDRDPLLRPQFARLREHFGKDARGPFALQRVPLAAGRVGVLVSRPDESDPIVLALDRDQLLFAKEHPIAGISPPALHATIAPAPERGVAVFAYVESLHLVAARFWADDSNPYADIEVFHPDACDALTVAYETGLGWIVACASKTGTRAQRLRDDLTSAWSREGVPVGTAGPVGRAELGFDGPSIWTLSQRARAVGGDRTLGFRYGPDAQPL